MTDVRKIISLKGDYVCKFDKLNYIEVREEGYTFFVTCYTGEELPQPDLERYESYSFFVYYDDEECKNKIIFTKHFCLVNIESIPYPNSWTREMNNKLKEVIISLFE